MNNLAICYAKMDPHCLAVGVTEVSFPAPTPARLSQPEAIFIQALISNTGNVVVSITGVAADGSQGGFILPPGSNIILPVNREETLKAIATVAAQKLSVVYLADPN
jgi:hypothetical protein